MEIKSISPSLSASQVPTLPFSFSEGYKNYSINLLAYLNCSPCSRILRFARGLIYPFLKYLLPTQCSWVRWTEFHMWSSKHWKLTFKTLQQHLFWMLPDPNAQANYWALGPVLGSFHIVVLCKAASGSGYFQMQFNKIFLCILVRHVLQVDLKRPVGRNKK